MEAAAERLSRATSSGMPQSRLKDLRSAFEQKLRDIFGELLSPQDFVMNNPVTFSGRAVMTPGKELQRDQVGIPESMAIKLFGPLVAREQGCSPEALDFSDGATRGALQDVMRRNLVLARRPDAPVAHRALLAYRPVLVSGNSIRVHSFVTYLMESDFDESSLGPTLLSVRSGVRGNKRQLRSFVGPQGLLHGTEDYPVTDLLTGWRGGIPHEFFFDHVRRTCGGVVVTVERLLNRDIHLVHRTTGTEYEETRAFQPGGNDVVARARRSRHPGVVFARAARQQLSERLRSHFGRIFVGLPPVRGTPD